MTKITMPWEQKLAFFFFGKKNLVLLELKSVSLGRKSTLLSIDLHHVVKIHASKIQEKGHMLCRVLKYKNYGYTQMIVYL